MSPKKPWVGNKGEKKKDDSDVFPKARLNITQK